MSHSLSIARRLCRRIHAALALACGALLVPTLPTHAAGVVYVVPGGAGAQTGTSWADAKDLQAALRESAGGEQLWVKIGTYKPTPGADRSATFQIKSGVALYGGFAGTETSLAQRSTDASLTILSGDLLGNDAGAVAADNPTRADNTYHVVTGSGTERTTVIDGFTITGGNANSTVFPDFEGAGLYVSSGQPGIRSVIFSENSAVGSGGGMANRNSNSSISRSIFRNNTAQNGGGMANISSSPIVSHTIFAGNKTSQLNGGGMVNYYDASPIVSHSAFLGNTAQLNGGGMANGYNSSPIVVDVIFSGNTAAAGGGAMYNADSAPDTQESAPVISQVTMCNNSALAAGALFSPNSRPTLRNSILWNNQGGQINAGGATLDVRNTLVQGGYPGAGNLDADPLLLDPDGPDNVAGTLDDNLRPRAGSPAIDAGSNAFIPADLIDDDGDGNTAERAPFDLDGLPRLVGPTVDMGAYERQHIVRVPLIQR